MFGPDDRWVELTTPALPSARTHPALAATRCRFDRGFTALDCPVRALRTLVDTSVDGTLVPASVTVKATIKGFNPASTPSRVPVRIAVRNRAMVCAGYHGALRVQELVRARVEHLDTAGTGLRLRLFDAKTSKAGASQFVLLRPQDAPLDPVSALEGFGKLHGIDVDGKDPLRSEHIGRIVERLTQPHPTATRDLAICLATHPDCELSASTLSKLDGGHLRLPEGLDEPMVLLVTRQGSAALHPVEIQPDGVDPLCRKSSPACIPSCNRSPTRWNGLPTATS